MKFSKLYWGGIFILAALLLIANQLSWITSPELSPFSIIITILIIPIIVASLAKRNFFGVFIPLAVLYAIFTVPLSLPVITFWPLVIATTLASIGCTILFHKKGFVWTKVVHTGFDDKETIINEPDSNNVECFVKFGASTKYVNSPSFQTAKLGCSFGALAAYFDNAIIEGDEATIYVDASFGGVELYIPKTWKVMNSLDAVFGGVEEDNRRAVVETTKTVHLKGSVRFAGIEIKYV